MGQLTHSLRQCQHWLHYSAFRDRLQEVDMGELTDQRKVTLTGKTLDVSFDVAK